MRRSHKDETGAAASQLLIEPTAQTINIAELEAEPVIGAEMRPLAEPVNPGYFAFTLDKQMFSKAYWLNSYPRPNFICGATVCVSFIFLE